MIKILIKNHSHKISVFSYVVYRCHTQKQAKNRHFFTFFSCFWGCFLVKMCVLKIVFFKKSINFFWTNFHFTYLFELNLCGPIDKQVRINFQRLRIKGRTKKCHGYEDAKEKNNPNGCIIDIFQFFLLYTKPCPNL